MGMIKKWIKKINKSFYHFWVVAAIFVYMSGENL